VAFVRKKLAFAELVETNPESALSPGTLLTSSQAAALLQTNRASINNWVRQGRLRASRTPGGHHRIRVADLMSFLCAHSLPVPQPLRGGLRRRVLIVDDDVKQLRALEKVLKPFAEQVEVHTVQKGIDALILIGQIQPHIVFLDLFMPDLDGIEVCKRLRQFASTKDCKIVITTGSLTRESQEAAKQAGASAFLQKPVSLRTLVDEIDLDYAMPQARLN
jgi:excisionase family DNA binding protein